MSIYKKRHLVAVDGDNNIKFVFPDDAELIPDDQIEVFLKAVGDLNLLDVNNFSLEGGANIIATLVDTTDGIKKVLLEPKTEEVLSEIQIEQESDLDNMIKQMHEGGVLTNKWGNIIFANPAAAETLELTHEEIIGKSFLDFVSEGNKDQILKERKERQTGAHGKYVIEVCTSGGMKIIEMRSSPRYDESGKFIGSIVAFEDITEKVEQEKTINDFIVQLKEAKKESEKKNIELEILVEELKKAMKQATESDRLKSAFLENISHEIRTPMNGILGFVDLLNLEDSSKTEQGRYIEIIKSSCDRLLEIVDGVIDIAKVAAGDLTVEKTDLDIKNILSEVVKKMEKNENFVKKGLKLELDMGKESLILNVDEEGIEQILVNLIGNAIKFTKTGKISVGYKENGKFIEFYVKDTGIGICSKKLKTIFDHFDRTENPASRGTGVGLPIAKVIVDKHDGDIWAESDGSGTGSTFYFTIPCRVAENQDVE